MQGTNPGVWPFDVYVATPVPKTAAPGNYGNGNPGGTRDHDLCYDPEGQGWDAGTPFGWPNAAWGIEWYKVDWGDGNTQFFPYATSGPGGNPGLQQAHQYTNLDVGANDKTIAVTAIDFLGGETTFTRDIRINRAP